MSPSVHEWFETVIQGLSDLFFSSTTEEQGDLAIDAFEETRRLYLEIAR